MNAATHKLAAGLLGTFCALVAGAPALLHKSALVALAFLALDSLTGWICAGFDHDWSSHVMRVKMRAKCAQYAVILVSAAGAGLLGGSWNFLVAGWWAIIAIEAHSNLENVLKWQKFGADLGPAKPLLDLLSQFFASGQISPQNQIVIPAGVIGGKKSVAADADEIRKDEIRKTDTPPVDAQEDGPA